MAEYNPADLGAYTLLSRPDAAAARVSVPPGGTLAHIAALYAEGAGGFAAIARANGVIDPIPYYGSYPRRSNRAISLTEGIEIILPRGGL